ncbi:MarR family transcriptional regulator [Parvibaculum sp.]|uniref:MarR family winged helix-turn-helix transcriptional regulator n=1 Tax=Parvibaculum sp. TaxID=2024848 RepID=UPI001B11E6EC|nr:MarR family transcriptional regulator [Parvibaculum sp.]MBO6668804.1 MarR family transcriptional regulator [Parvibaculum sp.]MBO6692528.1 MarR family transcriptional regulator [Parvibaculum sp.]MBO6715664.1 MarR family transcriptional regulator [Parvibaculum sp.]
MAEARARGSKTAKLAQESRAEALGLLNDPGYLLGDVTRLLRRAFERRVKATGLTTPQWRLLVLLMIEDRQSQTSLAQALDMERAAVGQQIDRLEAAGFVERKPDPSDKRVWRIHLNRRARDLVPTFTKTAHYIYARVFGHLSAEDFEKLLRSLKEARNALISFEDESASEDKST